MLPVILGIPFLAGLLGGLFAELFKFFAKWFTKKVAVRAAMVTGLLVMLAAFVGVIHGLIAGLGLVLPPAFADMLPLLIPFNMAYCISAMLTAKLARYAYDWNVRILQWTLPGV